jgi:DUF1680 family protein
MKTILLSAILIFSVLTFFPCGESGKKQADYPIQQVMLNRVTLTDNFWITGNRDYLHLSKKFLDLRGDKQHRNIRSTYSQDHLPVIEQDEAAGHAVRAVYMYAGMTDIAAIYGDKSYQ